MKKFLLFAVIICGLFYLCSDGDESSSSSSSSSTSSKITFAGTYTVDGKDMRYNSLYKSWESANPCTLDFSILEDGRVLLFGPGSNGEGDLCGQVASTNSTAVCIYFEKDCVYYVCGKGTEKRIKKYDSFVFDRSTNQMYLSFDEYNNSDVKKPWCTIPFTYNSKIRKNF